MKFPELLAVHNIPFKDLSLYQMAFTHCSCNKKNGKNADYDKLEFFGDSIIGFVVTEFLYSKHLQDQLLLNQLSKSKHYLISAVTLGKIAVNLNFAKCVLTDSKLKIKDSDSKICSDVFEAFIGALYLDLGLNTVKQFLTQHLLEPFYLESLRKIDYTSFLQEWMQQNSKELPDYSFKEEEKEFVATCCCKNQQTTAKGKTKKSARANAAFLMYKKLVELRKI